MERGGSDMKTTTHNFVTEGMGEYQEVLPVILAVDLPVEALVSGGDNTAQLDKKIRDHC